VDSPELAGAKLFRRIARRMHDAWEAAQTKAAREALFTAMKNADNAYAALSPADARAYRRWAFATAPEVLDLLPPSRRKQYPALRVIQGGRDKVAP